MKRKIVTDLQILKQKSKEIKITFFNTEFKSIIKDLEDSLDLTKGIGLSAIQIGISKKIAIIRFNKFNLNLINPVVLEKEEKFKFTDERCLSLPNLSINTVRYNKIKINNNGKILKLSGIYAVACQHEIDHCNGLTILDRKWRKR